MRANQGESRELREPQEDRGRSPFHKLPGIGATLWLLLLSTITMRGQCALDSFAPEPNNFVQAIAVQPDGKILVGGDFSSLSPNGGPPVPRNHLARLNPDGTVDMAFDCNANCNASGPVRAIAVQADGKVLIGGSFSMVGGQLRRFVARLDGTTGQVDSFDPNVDPSGSNFIGALALQTDGKIPVGGYFTSIGGQTRNKIARLDAATGLADSFDPNPGTGLSTLSAIAVQADGWWKSTIFRKRS